MSSPSRRTALRAGVAVAVFALLLFVRTRGISETFSLLGDQILYWRIALKPWYQQPIGGGPSSVGGTTLGPAFLWTMWLIRVVIGPWTDNLPHAGGIGLCIIQSAADAVLLVAIWRRFDSAALALAVVLLCATSPFDMALSATIWNPPLAVALVKVTMAIALAGADRPSLWWGAAATATGLLAVQAHSSAIFVAAPIAVSFIARELLARRGDRAAVQALVSLAVVCVLELPYAINLMVNPGNGTSPTVVVASVTDTLAHPAHLRLLESFHAIVAACAYLLFAPWTMRRFDVVLIISALIAACRVGRDPVLLCATIVPFVCAVAAFSMWERAYDTYWFLILAPGVALTLMLAVTIWRPAGMVAAAAVALLIIVVLPNRMYASMSLARLPEYGTLVRGSREVRRHAKTVRYLDTAFTLPPSTDRTFIYELLGGRVTGDAPFGASIEADGRVVFRPVDRPQASAER